MTVDNGWLQRVAKIEANYKHSVRVMAADHKAKLAQTKRACRAEVLTVQDEAHAAQQALHRHYEQLVDHVTEACRLRLVEMTALLQAAGYRPPHMWHSQEHADYLELHRILCQRAMVPGAAACGAALIAGP